VGKRLCLGIIVAPHGVRGDVRIRTFTERPEDIASYGPLTDETGGRSFDIRPLTPLKGGIRARIAGVKDRNAAEALKGTRLYVDRDSLPPVGDDAFYHADLIGLEARDTDGAALGTVQAVFDFGAGDMLEVALKGRRMPLLVPFTREAVPEIRIGEGYLVIDPPAETGGDDGRG